MKKRVKVFQSGKYPQGDYPIDRVKKIFENTKDFIQGIFIHSSHWEEEGKQPINCGEFSNFGIDEQEVYADLELNNEGMQFFQKGVFKGISVEIVKDKLDKIALLPLGVKPAIAGAEFEEYFKTNNVLEFEEITETENNIEEGEKMTIEEVLEFMENSTIGDKITVMSKIVGSLSEADTRAARALAWEFAEKTEVNEKDLTEFAEKKGFDIEVKEKAPMKTESEIRAEVEAEFEAKEKANKELTEFSAIVEKKILPAHREAYIEAYKSAQNKTDLIEFAAGEEKITMKAHLKEKVTGMTDINLTEEFAQAEQGLEFSRTESQKRLDEIKKVSEDTEKLTGGRR